jgi:argininosuccinate lyase
VAKQGDLARDGFETFRKAFQHATGRETKLDAAAFAEIVSPEYFVAVRTRYGGPAPEPLNAAIAGYRAEASELATRHQTILRRQAEAARTLNERFNALKGAA